MGFVLSLNYMFYVTCIKTFLFLNSRKTCMLENGALFDCLCFVTSKIHIALKHVRAMIIAGVGFVTSKIHIALKQVCVMHLLIFSFVTSKIHIALKL